MRFPFLAIQYSLFIVLWLAYAAVFIDVKLHAPQRRISAKQVDVNMKGKTLYVTHKKALLLRGLFCCDDRRRRGYALGRLCRGSAPTT